MPNKYSDGHYQEKVGEYVAKHVHHCLSTLVSEIAPKFMEGVFPDYSEEVYFDLFRIKPDQDDCENAGFQFFEYGGDWYYVQSLSEPDPEDHDLTNWKPLTAWKPLSRNAPGRTMWTVLMYTSTGWYPITWRTN